MSGHHQHHKYKLWDHKHGMVGWWNVQLLDDMDPERQATKLNKTSGQVDSWTREQLTEQQNKTKSQWKGSVVTWHWHPTNCSLTRTRQRQDCTPWVNGYCERSSQSVCPVCLTSPSVQFTGHSCNDKPQQTWNHSDILYGLQKESTTSIILYLSTLHLPTPL